MGSKRKIANQITRKNERERTYKWMKIFSRQWLYALKLNAIVYFLPSINYLTEMNTTARGVKDNGNDKDKKIYKEKCVKVPHRKIQFLFVFHFVVSEKILLDFD